MHGPGPHLREVVAFRPPDLEHQIGGQRRGPVHALSTDSLELCVGIGRCIAGAALEQNRRAAGDITLHRVGNRGDTPLPGQGLFENSDFHAARVCGFTNGAATGAGRNRGGQPL